MPLYEYQCKNCGEVVEIIQKFSDSPLTECEACGGQLERLLSPPAIQFKGAGWYVTDYASKNGRGSSPETSSNKTSAEKSTASSESKAVSGAEKSDS